MDRVVIPAREAMSSPVTRGTSERDGAIVIYLIDIWLDEFPTEPEFRRGFWSNSPERWMFVSVCGFRLM